MSFKFGGIDKTNLENAKRLDALQKSYEKEKKKVFFCDWNLYFE
jgi:hypothetical protein